MCQVMYRLGYKRVETLPVPLELTVKGLLSPENSLLWGWAQVWEPERMKRTLPVDWGEKGIPVQFSHSVTSNSLRPHEPQHARPPCPSPTPGVGRCLLLLLPSIFPSINVFSNESALHIRWPKYWSFIFNISPANEHPGLISFRMDWLDLLAVQGTLKNLLQQRS